MEPIFDLIFAVNLRNSQATSSFNDVDIEQVFFNESVVRDASVASVWDMMLDEVALFKSDRVGTWQYVTHVSEEHLYRICSMKTIRNLKYFTRYFLVEARVLLRGRK